MYQTTLDYFKEIAKIPRCSKHEEKVRNWLLERARKQGYTYKTDAIGNVVIFVNASKGREDEEILILQGHMDMVCVKEQGSEHDFSRDAIQVVACDKDGVLDEAGTWIKALGTTLGADNGMGVAMCLASTHLPSHPPLELLFTVDEEQGLTGALELDDSLLQGKKLINLDTEDLGEICISSAGGARIDVVLPFEKENDSLPHYIFQIQGMKGGHSGVDIDKNRGNALMVWIDIVSGYPGKKTFVALDGGVADNALPAFCEGVLGLEDEASFRHHVDTILAKTKQQYDCEDISYTLEPTASSQSIKNGFDLLRIIQQQKIGIWSMSEKIENLVQTSINLGICKTKNTHLALTYAPRSSVMEELDNLIASVEKNYTSWGGTVSLRSKYPGRQENPTGALVQTVKEVYESVLGYKKVHLVAYHAGLECGALVDKLGAGAQAVSFGPTIIDPHSPSERCDLEAVKKCCEVVKGIMRKRIGRGNRKKEVGREIKNRKSKIKNKKIKNIKELGDSNR